MIQIYCDGGCRGNQNTHNLGGYGIVIEKDNKVYEEYGIERNTTNNRMELTACIEALKLIYNFRRPITVTTDSLYLVRGITEWYPSWLRRDWLNSKGKPVENRDLWEELIFLKNRHENIVFEHVRGHSDNKGNNRADYLVNLAMDEYLESHKKHTL